MGYKLRGFALIASALATSAAASGPETVLHIFDLSEGAYPNAGLVLGQDGNFYGTASVGGLEGSGAVFKISPEGALSILYDFSGGSDGGTPQSGLTQGGDGNFYGTTNYGGPSGCLSGCGTVFKITPAGVLTTLHSFNGADGELPDAAPVQGSDGNFYGSTPVGGAYGFGTIFKMTPEGILTTLHDFSRAEGEQIHGPLVQGSDGNFYGTAAEGGAGRAGTVFKISPEGALTTLHSFTGGTDGGNPEGALLLARDGNFYGTTEGNGSRGTFGTVFKMSPDGVLTTIYSFSGSVDGGYPDCNLVQAGDGNFYGTTAQGGTAKVGTVFRISPAGKLTTLYSFQGGTNDGDYPHAGLAQGSNGSFYGTTYQGGPEDAGTVFRISGIVLPVVPTDLMATAGNGQVTLTWTGSGAGASYDVYQGTSPGGESSVPVVSGVTRTTATITGLSNGTTYYFEVAAVVGGNTSAPSSEASATPLSAPGPIVLLSAEPGKGQVVLHWSPSAGASSYTVYQGTASHREKVVAYGVTATNFVTKDLVTGTTYYFGVEGVNAVGAGPKSPEVTATPN